MSAATMSSPILGGDWRTALRSVLIVGLLLTLAGGGAWWLHQAHWPIEQVRIDGEVVHADRARLKEVVSAHARAGFFGMDLDALRADLRALPWVRDASLRRVWPHTLDAVVHEHDAAARWNEDQLLSRRGAVFAPDGIEVEGVPVLSGPEGHGPAMLQRLQRFTEMLAPLGLEIAALHQDARRGWRVELANGVALELGQTEHLQARLQRFAAVWPRALTDKAATIAAVDMRYPNGFAVDWRDDDKATGAREGGDA